MSHPAPARCKRYSSRQITRTLAKYDSVETPVQLTQDTTLSMVESADAYALLDRLLEQDTRSTSRLRFPYWAEIWPAAVGLSRWFAAHGEAPGQARELGCGVGLVGVALAAQGWQVEATDYVEDALLFSAHNAERNGVGHRHTVSYLDWSHPVGESISVLVGSDLAYEKALHPYLLRVVRALLKPGGRFVLSDPQRPAARPFFESLQREGFRHQVDNVQVEWSDLTHRVDVHSFVRPSA